MLAAVKQNGLALQFADVALQANYDIVLAAVRRNGWALRWARNNLNDNREIVDAALNSNIQAMQCASPDKQWKPKFLPWFPRF